METEKILANEKLLNAVDELNVYLTQIKSINNVLDFLYSFLSGEHKEISEPASVLVVCMTQLDYIYKHFDELLDVIIECNGLNQPI